MLVLEELEHAKARGARIYCELAGYGMSADAHHITAPPEDGDGAARSMVNALQERRHRRRRDIDYINAHGTSTPLGDIAECVAVKRAFGEHAHEARGIVDQVDDRTSARRRRRHRSRIHRARVARPDRAADRQSRSIAIRSATSTSCRLRARKMKIRAALSNSFGFGGTNATLAFRLL